MSISSYIQEIDYKSLFDRAGIVLRMPLTDSTANQIHIFDYGALSPFAHYVFCNNVHFLSNFKKKLFV